MCVRSVVISSLWCVFRLYLSVYLRVEYYTMGNKIPGIRADGMDVLAVRTAAEYCREHLCEDSIIFLLEAKSFQLLFDPRDRLAEARRIFETFLDMGSESRIAASNSVVAECKTVCRVVSALLLCPPMSNRNAVRCPQD